MFTYWAEVCHWVLHQWDQKRCNGWKNYRKKRTCFDKTCFDILRTEHTQQGLGNAVQIFTNIQGDESTSTTWVKLLVKRQLCTGTHEPGGVKISFPCPTASPLLPVSGSHSLCGGFRPSEIEMPQCTRPIAARPPHDKALPRSRVWPSLPALAGWEKRPDKTMEHRRGPFQPRLLPAPRWVVLPTLGRGRVGKRVGTPLLGWAVLCTPPILFGKLERDLEK